MAIAEKAVSKELLDRLLADYRKPKSLIGEHELHKKLTKLLVEQRREAEVPDHLGHGKNEPFKNPANRRLKSPAIATAPSSRN